jgi:hypothetical protein
MPLLRQPSPQHTFDASERSHQVRVQQQPRTTAAKGRSGQRKKCRYERLHDGEPRRTARSRHSLPYLEERAFKGRIVSTARGTLARTLQQDFGDHLLNTDDRTVWAVEIKVEQAWTGNLFLETWSNRNLESKATHAELGSTPGWLIKTRADMLLYYFLDGDNLVTVPGALDCTFARSAALARAASFSASCQYLRSSPSRMPSFSRS